MADEYPGDPTNTPGETGDDQPSTPPPDGAETPEGSPTAADPPATTDQPESDARTTGSEIGFVSEEGVSDQERSEVLAQIESVVTDSKLKVEPGLFSLASIRSGSIFPILVNGGALVAIAAGVFLLFTAFRGDERVISQRSVELQSVEGQVIRELRREAQQQLLNKDQQLAQKQRQVDTLEAELREFEASIGDRIAVR